MCGKLSLYIVVFCGVSACEVSPEIPRYAGRHGLPWVLFAAGVKEWRPVSTYQKHSNYSETPFPVIIRNFLIRQFTAMAALDLTDIDVWVFFPW